MTYTQLAVAGRARGRRLGSLDRAHPAAHPTVFWMAYPIIVFFQLLTNGVLTGFRIVRYSGEAILGSSTPRGRPRRGVR